MPEGVLGPGGAGRAEVVEKVAYVFLDAGEGDEPVLAALERRQGVEKEQRLVWGPFVAPAPDVDGGEAVEETLVTGLVGPSCHRIIMAVPGWGSCEQQGSRTRGERFQVMS